MLELKKFRRSRGLKQREMANIINTSLANYCKKEKGLVKVSLIEAITISEHFKIPIDDILKNEDK